MFRASGLLLVLLWAAAGQSDASNATGVQAAAKTCAPKPRAAIGPDADLYCIELLPAATSTRCSGTARLLSPSSPFGVAVTAAGEHQYDIQFDVQGLPPPQRSGRTRPTCAWATTPQMHPVVKLGEVGNGT